MLHERESRPAANRAASKSFAGDTSRVPNQADLLQDLDALAESLSGYLVVQVVIDDENHRRTTIYRSAGAAQRAVERAQARGRTAHVSLCQLLPVGVIAGGLR